MSICDSEENRKKLAWLVPGYILLAWFFCVLFQPLGIHSPTASRQALYRSLRDKNYQTVYLDRGISDDLCKNNSIVLTPGAQSSAIFKLGYPRFSQHAPFNCSVQIHAGEG